MYSIQENEITQLQELTGFLDLEITFVQSYLSELQKVKDGWVDACVHPLIDSRLDNLRQ